VLKVVDGKAKISRGFEMGAEEGRRRKGADRRALRWVIRRLEEAWDEAVLSMFVRRSSAGI